VADARVTVRTLDGEEASAMSRPDGSFSVKTPSGEVTVVFSEVDGLMGTPTPLIFTLSEGEDRDIGVIAYDTGIR
jgi:hypothetical protein